MSNIHTLEQKTILSGKRKFEIINDRVISIKVEGFRQKTSYLIDLVSLNPGAENKLNIAWPWLGAAIGMAFLFVIFRIILPGLFDIDLGGFGLAVSIVTAILSMVFLAICVMHSYLEKVYVSVSSGFPLVKIIHAKPNKKAYSDFIDHIESLIRQLSSELQLSEEKQRAGELRMMRRLTENGVIKQEQYDVLKTELLGSAVS